MPDIVPIFIISLLTTIFIRPWWLRTIISFVYLAIILGVGYISIRNSGKIDQTAYFFLLGAWSWGSLGGVMIRLVWAGLAQVTFKPPYQWLNWLTSAFNLAIAFGAIGYAFGSNTAVGYAGSYDTAVILYDRSMAAAAFGFLFLSGAASTSLAAFVKPALTTKGLRVAVGAIIEWRDIDSCEWQGTKLIIHRKIRNSLRWLRDSWVMVNPPDIENVNRILGQHLPGIPTRPSNPTQVTA